MTTTLLTIEEAAERMGTTPRFIRRLIAERRIGYTKLGERKVRLSANDVDEFIARGRVDPQAPRSYGGYQRSVLS